MLCHENRFLSFRFPRNSLCVFKRLKTTSLLLLKKCCWMQYQGLFYGMSRFYESAGKESINDFLKAFPEEGLKRNAGLWDKLRKITQLSLKKISFLGANWTLIFIETWTYSVADLYSFILILQIVSRFVLRVKNVKSNQTILNGVFVCHSAKKGTNLCVGRMESCMWTTVNCTDLLVWLARR